MAPEAFVDLSCPDCDYMWEAKPHKLPDPKEEFQCEDCASQRRLSEFMQTQRDLELVKEFHQN
ncbi:hypothetical protein [Haloarchaeobius sp. TZWWS8]|uniref:DUF7836 family putative zinc-binding protein n=1 Tax=Haloarchaeobius sp. TZWWS8 TaxID=3446121 RepID=UPI003EB720B5